MALRIHNTLSRSLEEFKPITPGAVRMYGCGFTSYDYPHIGNFRAYLTQDLFRRTFKYFSFDVTYGMNVTDVGHLTSDGDEGEDKLQKRAAEQNIDPLVLARKFETIFWENLLELNIPRPNGVARATDTIQEQQDIITLLLEKNAAYITEQAIYFDVTKAKHYGALSGQSLDDKRIGVRDEVNTDPNKRNAADFVLWFFLVGPYENHILRWPSPWGDGFPGWHIECSAISRKLLGQPFDIHFGGVDHIPVHHTNEIAQSETAYNEPLAHYWVHNNFTTVDGGKMGKSLGNSYTKQDLLDHGISLLAYRYFTLTAHYRTQQNVTWEALTGAREAYRSLITLAYQLKTSPHADGSNNVENHIDTFNRALENDINAPEALAAAWQLIKDEDVTPLLRYQTLLRFDEILGLSIAEQMEKFETIPNTIHDLAKKRDVARKNKDYAAADTLRDEITRNGYDIRDTEHGPLLIPLI